MRRSICISANTLNRAKKSKNDEFYTRYEDIEKEVIHYKDAFRDKVVYCNCDDHRKSQFVKYFHKRWCCQDFGIKGFFATGYHKDAHGCSYVTDDLCGYIYELVGDGDFRSPECLDLLEAADIVVTNPPFSLFREYLQMLVDYNKQFLVLTNINSVFCKNVFPYIKSGEVTIGINSGSFTFDIPKIGGQQTLNNICWVTNMKHEQPDYLNLTELYSPERYPRYDNYNAIEVPRYGLIPKDFIGEMGVPISCLPKPNTEQFEIIGSSTELAEPIVIGGKKRSGRFYLSGKRMYERLVIRRRRHET